MLSDFFFLLWKANKAILAKHMYTQYRIISKRSSVIGLDEQSSRFVFRPAKAVCSSKGLLKGGCPQSIRGGRLWTPIIFIYDSWNIAKVRHHVQLVIVKVSLFRTNQQDARYVNVQSRKLACSRVNVLCWKYGKNHLAKQTKKFTTHWA